MKKETMTLLCLFRVLFCVGCGKADPSNATIDYGASSVYSKQNMDAAIKVIKNKFTRLTAVSCIVFPKCTMSETTGGGFPGTIRFELEGSV